MSEVSVKIYPDYYTHTNGFVMNTTRALTKADMVKISLLLSDKMSLINGRPIKIEPQPITEGGFWFPEETGHKSIRFTDLIERIRWPWIQGNVMEEWKNDLSIVFPRKSKINTLLKALDGAPIWSLQELRIFDEVMTDFGVYVNKFPSAKSLKKLYIH